MLIAVAELLSPPGSKLPAIAVLLLIDLAVLLSSKPESAPLRLTASDLFPVPSIAVARLPLTAMALLPSVAVAVLPALVCFTSPLMLTVAPWGSRVDARRQPRGLVPRP